MKYLSTLSGQSTFVIKVMADWREVSLIDSPVTVYAGR
jgi:hypothetical protein